MSAIERSAMPAIADTDMNSTAVEPQQNRNKSARSWQTCREQHDHAKHPPVVLLDLHVSSPPGFDEAHSADSVLTAYQAVKMERSSWI